MNWEPLWALGLAGASRTVRRLPDRPRYACAAAIGRGVSRIFPDKRAAVERNLAVINDWAGTRFRVEKVFENFGMTLSDFLAHPPVNIRVEGREKAEEARRHGAYSVLDGGVRATVRRKREHSVTGGFGLRHAPAVH